MKTRLLKLKDQSYKQHTNWKILKEGTNWGGKRHEEFDDESDKGEIKVWNFMRRQRKVLINLYSYTVVSIVKNKRKEFYFIYVKSFSCFPRYQIKFYNYYKKFVYAFVIMSFFLSLHIYFSIYC